MRLWKVLNKEYGYLVFMSDKKRSIDEFVATKKCMIRHAYKCKTNEEVEQRFNSMFIVTTHED